MSKRRTTATDKKDSQQSEKLSKSERRGRRRRKLPPTGLMIVVQVVMVCSVVGTALYWEWSTFCKPEPCVQIGIEDVLEMNRTAYREEFPKPFFFLVNGPDEHKSRCPNTYFSPGALKVIGASLILGVALVVFRLILHKTLLKYLADWIGVYPEDRNGFNDSMMQMMFYAFGWCFVANYVLRQDFFYDTTLLFEGNIPNVPMDYYALYIYIYNNGLYLQFMYALYSGLESSKKDVAIMWIHHILTITLLYFSMVFGLWQMGVLVLFTHDICDVFLHSAKLWPYFERIGTYDKYEPVVYVLYVGLLSSWIVFRLVLFPLKVIYPSVFETVAILENAGLDVSSYHILWNPIDKCMYYFFNPMLLILLGLQIFWLVLIIKVAIVKIIGEGGWTDVREGHDKKDK